MTVEDYFGLPEDATITPDVIDALLPKCVPKLSRFPSLDVINEWLITKRSVPLFAGTPPVAEAAAIRRAALILADLEKDLTQRFSRPFLPITFTTARHYKANW